MGFVDHRSAVSIDKMALWSRIASRRRRSGDHGLRRRGLTGTALARTQSTTIRLTRLKTGERCGLEISYCPFGYDYNK